jgi:flagellin
MLSLHTNAASLSAQNSLSRTQNSLSTSMTRLSTGYRINSAMDDAAGLQIATRLKAQTSGMAVAMRNTQNSTSMLQTAGGALTEVTNMMVRMKDLATQAADQSSSANDKTALQAEFKSLSDELTNVVNNTSFGGQNLFGSGGTLTAAMSFQIGASSAETMSIDVSSANGDFTGDVTTLASADLTSGASGAIDTLTTAIDHVGTLNSKLGAAANRLDHVYNNLSNISTNVQNATGRIMDVDFATESSNMTSNQMLMQAGTAMLKQTNSMSSMVMSLLQ